jgi:hypothetical protein
MQAAYRSSWRDSVFIEYYYNSANCKCDGYCTEDTSNNFIGIRHVAGSPLGDTSYAEYQNGSQAKTNLDFSQVIYIAQSFFMAAAAALRVPVAFNTQVDFVEYFNLTEDSWQMKNLHKTAPNATLQVLHTKLHKWFECKGESCM